MKVNIEYITKDYCKISPVIIQDNTKVGDCFKSLFDTYYRVIDIKYTITNTSIDIKFICTTM